MKAEDLYGAIDSVAEHVILPVRVHVVTVVRSSAGQFSATQNTWWMMRIYFNVIYVQPNGMCALKILSNENRLYDDQPAIRNL